MISGSSFLKQMVILERKTQILRTLILEDEILGDNSYSEIRGIFLARIERIGCSEKFKSMMKLKLAQQCSFK